MACLTLHAMVSMMLVRARVLHAMVLMMLLCARAVQAMMSLTLVTSIIVLFVLLENVFATFKLVNIVPTLMTMVVMVVTMEIVPLIVVHTVMLQSVAVPDQISLPDNFKILNVAVQQA